MNAPARGVLPAIFALGLMALAPSCVMRDGSLAPTAAQQRAEAARGLAELAFTDGNIAAVLRVVNLMEIQPSQLAVERAQTRMVRDFARTMIQEHARADQRMVQILSARGIQPADNALSYQLTLNLEATLAELQQVEEARFDVAYVLQQLGAHQLALHSLDTNLIPTARDPELRQFLSQELRPSIAMHYAELQRLHAMLTGVGS